MAEKTIYVVNKTFISHEILGVVFPRGHFVAINEPMLKELKKNGIFASLLKQKSFELKDEIDNSMRTTEEQLHEAKTEVSTLKAEASEKDQKISQLEQERDNIKQEALTELQKKDQEIAELKAKLGITS